MTQEIHKATWTNEQPMRIALGRLGPILFLSLASGLVALKADTTVMVLARVVDTQTVKIIPKAACRRAQVTGTGWPMNMNGQRKHNAKEKRRI